MNSVPSGWEAISDVTKFDVLQITLHICEIDTKEVAEVAECRKQCQPSGKSQQIETPDHVL